jgi:hypothetical protein
VGERREIPGGAHRALAGNQRQQARVHECEQLFDDDGAHAGKPARQARRLERQHQAHGGIGQRGAHARGVRAHQVELKRREILVRDAGLRQLPESGIDPVQRLAAGEALPDRRQRALDRVPPAGGELDPVRAARDPAQVGERNPARLQGQLAHG